MNFTRQIVASLITAFSLGALSSASSEKLPKSGVEEGVLSLSTLEIRPTPKILPETATKEDRCNFMDEQTLVGVYNVLEEFNEQVGADFQIIALDDTDFTVVPSPDVPRKISRNLVSAYRYQAGLIERHILESQKASMGAEGDEEPCPMLRSVNALNEFMIINDTYEEMVLQEEALRREGVITPEMFRRRPPIFTI